MTFAKLSHKSLVEKLTEKYEEVFLKNIKKEPLTEEEHQFLYEGINKVERYIKNYIYNIQFTQNLSKLDKYIIFLLKRLSFIESLEEDINDIIRNNIYMALGYDKDKKNVFIKDKKNSFFILYVKDLAYYDILTFLKKKESELETLKEEVEVEDLTEKVEHLLEVSKIKYILDDKTYKRLKNVLLGEESFSKDLQPYIDFLKDIVA